MALTNYRRGAEKERRIAKRFREEGCVVVRSAGSHSPVDVVVINIENKEIKLIQAKLTNIKELSPAEKERILNEGRKLNGIYKVVFELWD